jgi:hypothetical protein
MVNNTIVVKPSHNAQHLDSFEQIKNQRSAVGFRGKLENVQMLDYIVVTDGTESFIGKIKQVKKIESDTIPRVIIDFEYLKEFDSEVINNIRWSSSNVRYKFLDLV